MASAGAILPTERQTQRAILQMVRLCFPTAIVHHSPNGAFLAGPAKARCMQVGALLGDGMVRGWPDLIVLWEHGRGCLVEVNRPGLGRISDEQKAIHARSAGIGWEVATVSSIREAFDVLKSQGAPWSGAKIA